MNTATVLLLIVSASLTSASIWKQRLADSRALANHPATLTRDLFCNSIISASGSDYSVGGNCTGRNSSQNFDHWRTIEVFCKLNSVYQLTETNSKQKCNLRPVVMSLCEKLQDQGVTLVNNEPLRCDCPNNIATFCLQSQLISVFDQTIQYLIFP